MKKLLLIIATMISLTAKSQTSVYHPFPDSNATWCDYFAFNVTQCFYEDYATHELNGQTMINGTVYNRLLNWGRFCDYCAWSCDTDTATIYIRQDIALKKVWLYCPGTNSDTILYDFNLQVGDTLNQREHWAMSAQPPYWIVNSIDSILIGGNYRKRFYYSSTLDTACFSSMIEGIGADHGLFNSPQTCFEYAGNLNKFYQDGILLYGDSIPFYVACHDFTSGIAEIKTKKSVSIFPNPFHASAQLEFNSDFENAEFTIYNILGVPVRRQKIISPKTTIYRDRLQDGIYFYQIINRKGNLTGGKFVIE